VCCRYVDGELQGVAGVLQVCCRSRNVVSCTRSAHRCDDDVMIITLFGVLQVCCRCVAGRCRCVASVLQSRDVVSCTRSLHQYDDDVMIITWRFFAVRSRVLQVCCRALQVCCRVLLMCCSVMQSRKGVFSLRSSLQCDEDIMIIPLSCSVLQGVAGVLQGVAVT